MLAIVFAVNKFHQYTFGRCTKVLSDHRPLQYIVMKPLCMAPKRLQGMMLKLQQYDLDIEYHPGKLMHVADLLSRSYLPSTEGGEEFERVNQIAELPIGKQRLKKIQNSSIEDSVLTLLRNMVCSGWPDNKSEIPCELHPYFHFRDELNVQDGLVFKAHQIVIPHSMRREVREALHSSHSGIEGCLRRARECVFWPGMNADLKEFVSQCELCNKYQSSQQKESLMTHEPSDRPWEKVGVDLMELHNQQFLVTVDYYSNYWEVDNLLSTTSKSVIKKLKAHFARFGIPSILISDNGPQFISREFASFTEEWDIEHRTSSPGHPQANGKAEAAVKISKRIIKRALDANKDPQLAILEYRNIPTQDAGTSPVQRMLGRRTRTLLPIKAELLKQTNDNQLNGLIKQNQRLRNNRRE